jgi:nicotinamide-nucleotide amidase
MKSIFNDEIIPFIKKENGDFHIVKKTILTAGELEAVIADKLKYIVNSMPKNMSFAYLPNLGRVRLRIIAKGLNKKELENQVNNYTSKIKEEINHLIFGYDDETIEEVVGKILIKNKMTLGTAESCTGGMIAHKITSVSGSSNYFKGSIVAYSNEIKANVLKVNSNTLEKYGAVSEQTVKEMVIGTLNVINCDIAIATSGIAGPTGGTPEKPVGTIWLACGTNDKIITLKLQLGNNRIKNIETSTIFALNMIRKMILQKSEGLKG